MERDGGVMLDRDIERLLRRVPRLGGNENGQKRDQRHNVHRISLQSDSKCIRPFEK